VGEGADWWVEQRYRAVLEVRTGSPVAEVADRYGVSRQAVYGWRSRFAEAGVAGLTDRSRRPHRSPSRTTAALEAEIAGLRREHPRWGARRIAHELAASHGAEAAPSRATVHRVLVRHELVAPQEQRRPRKYKRWARETPMALWQLDLVGGVHLADGREVKMVSGIDDHSRYVVVAALVVVPTGRAVTEAFLAAMARYGVPGEVLTDNGKQFTGRYTRPAPVEVLFERTCREHGITARLTKRRSPTTTGKIERFHQTLRRELLDQVAPFADLETAQAAIDAWVQGYNHARPHQSLDMATPADLFRPGRTTGAIPPTSTAPTPADAPDADAQINDVPCPTTGSKPPSSPSTGAGSAGEVPVVDSGAGGAVELDVRVPSCGSFALAAHQQVWLGPAYGARVVTVWADVHTVHISLENQVLKTVPSRLSPTHLAELRARGARPATTAPAPSALPRNARHADAHTVVELDRVVGRDGIVRIDGTDFNVGVAHTGTRVALRLDGHLVHAVAGRMLLGSWPHPIDLERRLALRGARRTAGPLPAPTPAHAPRAQRVVGADGVVMVARQRLRIGRAHAGKTITVIAEDTSFRVLDGDLELTTFARDPSKPLTRFKAWSRGGPTTMS
jgi:transposase InsO family protein